jgi:arylsulfatase A-like enzyme
MNGDGFRAVDNVIVVVVDALRADRVGAVSGSGDLTPNVDRLAREGAVFENAFTSTNATDPAITSLHTGRHPQSNGLLHHGRHVTDREKRAIQQVVQIPEALRDDGIRTIKTGRAMGRWHTRGFDDVPAVAESFSGGVSLLSANEWLKSAVKRVSYGLSNELGYGISAIQRRLTDNSTSAAVETMLEKVGERSPFYGFVHLMDTHIPYEPRQELIDEYESRYDDGESLEEFGQRYPEGSISRKEIEIKRREHGGFAWRRSPVDTAHVAARYDGAVREADEKVGRLVEGLERRGLLADTALFVLSDHGESLTEHAIPYDHHGLYECTVRIPLVVSVPGVDHREVEELVEITDVAPTVLDLFGVSTGLEFDGQSLVPLLTGDDEWEPRDAVVAEEAHTQRKRMIRTRDRKCIWTVGSDDVCRYCEFEHAAPEAMFELDSDPAETDNVADENPAEFETLRRTSAETRSAFERKAPDESRARDPVFEDEESVLNRLEQLGYR